VNLTAVKNEIVKMAITEQTGD